MEKKCSRCYFWSELITRKGRGICENAKNILSINDDINDIKPFGILDTEKNENVRLITFKDFSCSEFEENEDSKMTENEYINFMNNCTLEYGFTETDNEKLAKFEEKLVNVRLLLTYKTRKSNIHAGMLYEEIENLLDCFDKDSGDFKNMRRIVFRIEMLMKKVYPLLKDYGYEKEGE